MEIEEGTNEGLLLSVTCEMMTCLKLFAKSEYLCYSETQRYFHIKSSGPSVLKRKGPTATLQSESSELQGATLVKLRWWEFNSFNDRD